jgi:hypothetical protein
MFNRLSMAIAALVTASAGLAQDTCQTFRAAMPLAYDNRLASYVGPVYALLGDEMLIGKAVPGDTPTTTTCDSVSCQDRGGTTRFIFRAAGLMDKGDSLTIELFTAVYTLPGGFGIYHATEKAAGGTGRFEKATGLMFESGPYVAWMDDKGEIQAQYMGEIGGSLCGVKPATHATTAAVMSPVRELLSPSRRK